MLPFLGDERSRRIVEVAEKHADGLATGTDLAAAREAALDAQRGAASHIVSWVGDHGPWQAARMIVVSLQQVQTQVTARDWGSQVSARTRGLLHCVFANPFRPVRLNPAWLAWNAGTVVKIAQATYEDRDLPSGHLNSSRLCILADALEEAGCSEPDIVAHLRSPGPHVRGCWVVDLLWASTDRVGSSTRLWRSTRPHHRPTGVAVPLRQLKEGSVVTPEPRGTRRGQRASGCTGMASHGGQELLTVRQVTPNSGTHFPEKRCQNFVEGTPMTASAPSRPGLRLR